MFWLIPTCLPSFFSIAEPKFLPIFSNRSTQCLVHPHQRLGNIQGLQLLTMSPPFTVDVVSKLIFASVESGRKFYGCQHWPVDGCGFFIWMDDMDSNKKVGGGKMQGNRDEVKTMIAGLGQKIGSLQREVNCVRHIVENEVKERKKMRKMFVLASAICFGYLGVSQFEIV
ncbi:unnamed protein product [Cuscuta epithymum]|uniref:Zinc finger GRF-type domain-containing protein n=1 Tax=Cuscuta epithymum TaxID=186058 RepID=A0AAV0DY83_9ASTE|nr:unnamed protein product [Cuscuta epithymum]